MADQFAADPEPVIATAVRVESPKLHIASALDVAGSWSPDSRFGAILSRGDLRDQAAELRDRAAEARSPVRDDPQGSLDRYWAGRDRDAAAIDRAELVALLDERRVDAERANL